MYISRAYVFSEIFVNIEEIEEGIFAWIFQIVSSAFSYYSLSTFDGIIKCLLGYQ